jgi:hypothetical protein
MSQYAASLENTAFWLKVVGIFRAFSFTSQSAAT